MNGIHTCSDCPAPKLSGEPEPTTRCAECPYHGWVKVIGRDEKGRRTIRFQPSECGATP